MRFTGCRAQLAEARSEIETLQVEIFRLRRELSMERVNAATDPLTGLWNRRGLQEAIAAEVHSATIDRPRLLIIDADKFKAVNDNYGYDTGDQIIIAMAGLLRDTFGPGSIIARHGGDEFVVIAASERVESVRGLTAVTDLPEGGHGSIAVSLSAGITEFGGRRDLSVVMREADLALKRVKRAGGGIGFYNPSLDGDTRISHRPLVRVRDRHLVEVSA